jgi:hypothetical protein
MACNLDRAFEIRVTLAIRYEWLDRDARLRVWHGRLDNVAGPVAADIDCAELIEQWLKGY